MKTILFILLFFPLSLVARDVSIAWNANPATDEVTEYRVWLKAGTTFSVIKTVPGTTTATTISVPDGKQVVFVTAFNGLESDPSDTLTIPVKPKKPAGLKVGQ
jgi:hypothetical protein